MTNWYPHLYQGKAGVIELPGTKQCYDDIPRPIHAVGFAGCRTCVCIYVSLDDKHCFAAHMSASVWENDSKEKWIWWLSEEQGSDLEKHIHDKLSQNKMLVNIVRSEKYQKSEKEAAICCPHQEWYRRKASGSHIIAALKNFFALDEVRVQAAHGFVRDHVSPETTFCQYRCGEQSNIEFSNEMWHVSAAGEGKQRNDAERNHAKPETRSSSPPDSDKKTRASEAVDRRQVPPNDTDDDASSVRTEALDDGRPIELWPQFYGWEGVKRVEARTVTKFGRSMHGEWNFVWCADGYGWRSGQGDLPIELNCLK